MLGFGILSVTHPTRLETRTKESNMGASHWVAKPKGVMNVKTGFSQLTWDLWLLLQRTMVPPLVHCHWGGDRACMLGPERW